MAKLAFDIILSTPILEKRNNYRAIYRAVIWLTDDDDKMFGKYKSQCSKGMK